MKNKMIEQGFNYADSSIEEMTDFIKTRVENLEPNEDMILQLLPRKPSRKPRKRKREDSDSSVVESSEESTEARRPSKKYCIFNGKCSHSTDSYMALRAMVNKHKQKKEENFRNYKNSNKELNAVIEKKSFKNKKRKKTEKELQHFQEM